MIWDCRFRVCCLHPRPATRHLLDRQRRPKMGRPASCVLWRRSQTQATPGGSKPRPNVPRSIWAKWTGVPSQEPQFYPSGSRITGSMILVFLSTASTMVRCSTPSPLLATTGRTWRRLGREKRTVNVPSGCRRTGSPLSVT